MSEKVRPTGWRILVRPVKIEERTTGGIYLPEQAKEAKEALRYVGQVVAMGPLCYQHAKFEGGEPWCQVGDHIAFGQYAGQEILAKSPEGVEKLRLINDDEVLCTLESAEAVTV